MRIRDFQTHLSQLTVKKGRLLVYGLVFIGCLMAGIQTLGVSNAESYTKAVEAESGTKNTNANAVADDNASNKQAVTFKTPHAPTCTNNDGTPCPASYFTGPLGHNNIVPASAGAFLIEQYGSVGYSWAQKQAGITERQQAIGRKFDGIQVQYWGGGTWGGVAGMEDPTQYHPSQEQFAIDSGAKFVAVAWNPDFTIAQMNAGAADAIWAKAANYWKSFSSTRIMLRTMIEFNIPTTKYSTIPDSQNGNVNSCGAPFQTAWQRMVRIFKENGATNVGFWFNPTEGDNRQCVIDSYPGDAYTDWIGSDDYSGCATGDTNCYATPLHAGWANFNELVHYTGTCADGNPCPNNQYDVFGSKKPFVIGETGANYHSDTPADKGNYYASVVPGAKPLKYLRGISFFDQDVSSLEGTSNNWLVDAPTSDPSVYDNFKQMAADPWLNTH